jgi:septal ring factor EnvC (AmiA/AmiB activator)
VESYEALRKENAGLRAALADGGQRIRSLDSELIAANQRRQDAYKRIGELISHLDQLDAQLAEAGE